MIDKRGDQTVFYFKDCVLQFHEGDVYGKFIGFGMKRELFQQLLGAIQIGKLQYFKCGYSWHLISFNYLDAVLLLYLFPYGIFHWLLLSSFLLSN